jgi:tetratricopeptide (TPR) repeat protein
MMTAMTLAVLMAMSTVPELASDLTEARRSWDADAVIAVQSRVRSELRGSTDDEAVRLRVRSGLAVAEILRVEYERVSTDRGDVRRVLGDRIDAAAEEALSLLDELPESSDRERMRADLLATMIRSDYRAKRFEPELRAAVDRALELDPDNPLAHVAAAKPLLFAPEDRGRDVDAALEHLDRALALDPQSESARLLRAAAREMAGDVDGSRDDARAALAANPSCAPARRMLEHLGGS